MNAQHQPSKVIERFTSQSPFFSVTKHSFPSLSACVPTYPISFVDPQVWNQDWFGTKTCMAAVTLNRCAYPTVDMVTKAHQKPSKIPRWKGLPNSSVFVFISCLNLTGQVSIIRLRLNCIWWLLLVSCYVFQVPFIALNVFAYFFLMRELLPKRKNLFLINSAQVTTFLNLNK